MCYFLSDGRPLIWMNFIRQRAEFEPHITVRLTEIPLLEFFHHHIALNFQHIGIKRQAQHAVTLQPEAGLNIRCSNGEVVIGNIGTGEGIIFTTYPLQGLVIAWNIFRTTKHQMFK